MTIEDACLYVADGAQGRVCCVGYLHAKCLIPARHEHVASACVNDWSRRAPFGDVGYPVWLRLPRSVQPPLATGTVPERGCYLTSRSMTLV